MKPSGLKREKSPAMKSNLKPGEVRALGENVQVWAVRLYGVVPKIRRAQALQLMGARFLNAEHDIYLSAADFQAPAPAPAEGYTLSDLKANKKHTSKRYRGLSVEQFADTVWKHLPNITKKTRVLLVIFGTPDNYGPLDIHDLDSRMTYTPAGAESYSLKFVDKKKKQSLEFLDLAAFFPDQELGEVAETFNLSRDLAEPTRPEENTLGVRAYTLQDAQLTWRIFSELRRGMLQTWKVDPAVYRTPASCAARVYVSQYLKAPVGAVTRQIRLQAMRSYWGGRIEAFFRGRHTGDVSVYDAVSLYPQAAMNLGSLPTADSWYRLTRKTLHTCAGGICTVDFKFPPDELHPCLPVHAGGKNFYPLAGVSHCTAQEVRYALECGAEIILVEGYGYDLENGDTSLSEYSRDLLARKNAADRAGNLADRTMFKLLMNSLYGKFGQHRADYSLETLREICREYGYPDLPRLYKTPNWQLEVMEKSGEIVEPEIYIGEHWCPEWAALINGYARYIESRAMREYVALTGTVDSVVISGDAGDMFFIEGVKFKREKTGDTLVSVRARLYVITEKGKVVKAAVHGAPKVEGMPEKIAAWKRETELKISAVRVRKLRDGLTTGQMVGRVKDKEQTVNMEWDYRRIQEGNYSLPYPDIQPFITAEQIEGAAL